MVESDCVCGCVCVGVRLCVAERRVVCVVTHACKSMRDTELVCAHECVCVCELQLGQPLK